MIFIDILGMGSSSRPKDFNHNSMNEDQCTEYFNESIEKWRI